MSHQRFTESAVEDAALAWLEGLGYGVLHGPEIAFGEPGAERFDPDYRDVILTGRLREALGRLGGVRGSVYASDGDAFAGALLSCPSRLCRELRRSRPPISLKGAFTGR